MAAEQPTVQRARERLTSAILSDTLDGLGLAHQIMASQIRPLDEHLILCGRAQTGQYEEASRDADIDDVYEPVVELVDSLQPDEVMVLACGRSGKVQPWGEILSEAAIMRGAVGCVTDGLMRDVRQIRALRFPVFSTGYGAMETRGRARLVARNEPVQCGGIWVSPGDLVFGDVDGVLVVPQDVEAEVLRRAFALADEVAESLRELRKGRAIGDVYGEFGSF